MSGFKSRKINIIIDLLIKLIIYLLIIRSRAIIISIFIIIMNQEIFMRVCAGICGGMAVAAVVATAGIGYLGVVDYMKESPVRYCDTLLPELFDDMREQREYSKTAYHLAEMACTEEATGEDGSLSESKYSTCIEPKMKERAISVQQVIDIYHQEEMIQYELGFDNKRYCLDN
jgi:hypothetical protein